MPLDFIDLGKQALKNIEEPVHAYEVKTHVRGSAARAAHSQPLALPDKPSIAVLPFQNMSGDPAKRCRRSRKNRSGSTASSAHRTCHWKEAKKGWVLFDAQIDERERELFKTGFDTADVPRDQFVVVGDAWSLCRGGKADPSAFGILDMHGLWFIAGNIVRDIAALNNREMLPWDVWGAMRRNDSELDFAFFDRLALVSREPDAHVDELNTLYRDQRVSVPGTVFNAVLNRPEEL